MRSLQRGSRKLLLCFALGLLAGCDSVVEIEGSVVSATKEPLDDCTATLFLASTGEELQEINLDTNFSDSFIIGQVQTNFYVEITCEGYSTYRSPIFYSSGVLGDPPAQLGDIVLRPVHANAQPVK